MRYRNCDPGAHRPRSWNDLANAETGTTLELCPGDEADVLRWQDGVLVETSEGDVFPFLESVKQKRPLKPTAAPEPAGDNPDEVKE